MSISIVWISTLPGDTEEAAESAADGFRNPRIRQFYDPAKRSGKAIAKSIGYEDRIAWDIYLFYSAGAKWIENPPAPNDWLHQLSENWIDRERYHTGDDLGRELSVTTKKFLQPDSKPHLMP